MEEKQNYYNRNKQARKEYQRTYYIKNRDRIRTKRRVEELADPEKFVLRKEYNNKYYLKNKERILSKRAEAYKKKKEASKNNTTME